jgi:hypothetical protein
VAQQRPATGDTSNNLTRRDRIVTPETAIPRQPAQVDRQRAATHSPADTPHPDRRTRLGGCLELGRVVRFDPPSSRTSMTMPEPSLNRTKKPARTIIHAASFY